MSGVEWHEKWCGINCEGCGRRCTCPTREKTVLHPHYAVPRTPEECPARNHHHMMKSCGYCDYRTMTIGLWATPTTSSGRFEDAKHTLNDDLTRVALEDGGWSEHAKRLFGWLLAALILIATVVYVGARYWS